MYKIHGCVTQPESIVINEEDYKEFINKNAYLASKILTLFLEHPIIFIGYSINDPNIEEILSSIVECLNEDQLEILRDRFIFVEWNNSDDPDRISTFQKSFKNGKRIDMTYLYIKDYSWFYESLTLIQSKYKAPILRKLKSEIYDLVLSNEPKQSLQVMNLEDDKLEDLEIVVGVGVIRYFAEKGYEGVSVKEIYEDIIFDNKNFDPVLIVEKALPTLLRRHSNSIPIYKYIKDYEEPLPEQIEKEIKTELKQFLNKGLINRSRTVNIEHRSVNAIAEEFELARSLEYICFLSEEEINLDELCNFLQTTFNETPNILEIQTRQIATNFRRVVKIYDFLRYKN
nr:SIR2 family protein [Shouchella shacheensis]